MKRAREPALPFAERVFLVTGAGGGLGRAICTRLAENGAAIVAADVDGKGAAATAALCEPRALAITVDVGSSASVDKMVAAAVAKFGRLDGAVNAAGIEGERARLHETTEANFDKVLDVNLKGVFLCMRAELAQMMKQTPPAADTPALGAVRRAKKTGGVPNAKIDTLNYVIVNVSSTAGLGGMAEFCGYSASKHAIQGLTKSAAREYAADGIRICSVCPSTTATPMVERFAARWPDWQAKQNASFPVGRVGRAEEVAAACAFLLSAECPMMTGTTITIDGGLGA